MLGPLTDRKTDLGANRVLCWRCEVLDEVEVSSQKLVPQVQSSEESSGLTIYL